MLFEGTLVGSEGHLLEMIASIFTKEADIDVRVNFASNSSLFWLESINLKIANVL